MQFIIDENIDNNTICKFEILMDYLEKNWTIKKINSHYILKKTNQVKSILLSNYESTKQNNRNNEKKNIYINIFIYNTLEKGWTIKKQNSRYIFKKKHGDKKEYFSQQFLNDFIVSNMHKI